LSYLLNFRQLLYRMTSVFTKGNESAQEYNIPLFGKKQEKVLKF